MNLYRDVFEMEATTDFRYVYLMHCVKMPSPIFHV